MAYDYDLSQVVSWSQNAESMSLGKPNVGAQSVGAAVAKSGLALEGGMGKAPKHLKAAAGVGDDRTTRPLGRS